MQFVVHRDPVATSGWATALGATGDAINNLLRVYTNYQQEKKAETQRQLENQWKQEEMDLRKLEADRAAQTFQLGARKELENALVRAGSRPTVKTGTEEVSAVPDFGVDALGQAAEAERMARERSAIESNPFGIEALAERARAAGNEFATAPLDVKLGQTTQAPAIKAPEFKDPTVTRDVMAPAPTETIAIPDVTVGGVKLPGYQGEVRYQEEVDAKKRRDDLMAQGGIAITPDVRAALEATSPALAAIYKDATVLTGPAVGTVVDFIDRRKQEEARLGQKQEEAKVVGKTLWAQDASGVWRQVGADSSGGGEGDGKKNRLTSGERNRLTDFRSALNILGNLTDTVSDTGTLEWAKTKVPNILSEWTGWGEDAKARNATLLKAKQIIGKAMEGGVLRKEDEAKYEKMLPNIKDTPNLARAKLADLVSQMIEDASIYLDDLETFNMDIGGFRSRLDADVAKYRDISARQRAASGATTTTSGKSATTSGTAEEWTLDANGNPVKKTTTKAPPTSRGSIQ